MVGKRTGVQLPPRGALPINDDGFEDPDAFFDAAKSPAPSQFGGNIAGGSARGGGGGGSSSNKRGGATTTSKQQKEWEVREEEKRRRHLGKKFKACWR